MADQKKNHGLAAWLRLAKGRPDYSGSAITTLIAARTPFRKSINKADHMRRLLFRAMRRKEQPGIPEWNALVERIWIRFACAGGWKQWILISDGQKNIIGWTTCGLPMTERLADLLSDDPSEHRWISATCGIKEKIEAAMMDVDGPYCPTNDQLACWICGRAVGQYVTPHAVAEARSRYIWSEPERRGWIYLRSSYVCRDRRCRAISCLAVFPNRKKTEPLVTLIMEITKHGGNNENYRRLAKHFV